ncbi:hypothetical protein BKA57DRAFT_478372 [Linnemannia elongata]|nr:hypothetical protein BKA57DRAFT_478372 [Linnemannia elongata]
MRKWKGCVCREGRMGAWHSFYTRISFFFSWCSLRWFLLIIFLLCQTKRACPWRKNLGTQLQDSQHAYKPQEEEK